MSKREARVERKLAKALKQNEKSARLKERPTETKTPRLGANPDSIFGMLMTWTAEHADCNGAWKSGTVRQWAQSVWDGEIEPKLNEWARLMWWEIDRLTTGNGHKMHHLMPVETIMAEAQDRLVEIEKVDDDIFRFRLGNKPRLWGFRIGAEFQILWFDPLHEIYPTDPS